MALSPCRVTPVASLIAAEMTLPPTLSSTPSCSGAILPQVRYAAGSKSSARHRHHLQSGLLSMTKRAVTMGTPLQRSDVIERMPGVQGRILRRGQLGSYLGTAAEWP